MENRDTVTSKEILDEADISRATLNNYIKLGILPRPVVGSVAPHREGKQIGHFPVAALAWIDRVKQLKQQGRSMTEIAHMFQDREWVRSIPPPGHRAVEKKSEEGKAKEIAGAIDLQKERAVKNGLEVTIDNLTSPAYLVNNNLEIEWINEQAEHLLFNCQVSSIVNVESRNIFKLLFDQDLHGFMENWHDAVELHCTLLQRHMDSDGLAHVYEGIADQDVSILREAYAGRTAPATDNLYRLHFSFVSAASGSRRNYFVHSIAYREGTFLVFVPTDDTSSYVVEMLAQRGKLIQELLRNRMPSMVSLCALVASFQDSERVCAELLPTQYFRLINELWQVAGPVFEKYGGTYGRHAGDEILYYFVKGKGDDYLRNSINCAVELRDVMSEFSFKWSQKKGWAHNLYLNIGIHEGREFFGTIHTGGSIEFTALGDSVRIARQLAGFSQTGEIWATKDLISRMPREDRHDFRFGVYRDQTEGRVLHRNAFSLAGDLMEETGTQYKLFRPIANLAITEITGKQRG